MKETYKKILEKAIELCMLSDQDEIIFGNSYVDIGERSINVLDAKKVEINYNKCKKKIYGKSPIKSMGDKKCKDKGVIQWILNN